MRKRSVCPPVSFGGERQISSSSGNHYKFTSKERDPESGLDDFGLRYYSFLTGRFIIPDEPLNDADLTDPQRLNLYMYSRNNPLLFVDDSGQEIKYAPDLKNADAVRDVVNAILANPETSWTLSGYVGPNNPELLITSGDLSSMDQTTLNPDGRTTTTQVLGTTQPDIQTATVTDNGVTGQPETQLNSTTITIDKRVTEVGLPGVMTHESEHAGEARKDPAKFEKDAKAEQSLPYKDRPQEQRAKAFEEAHSGEIGKAAKEAQKQRKQEQKRKKQEEKKKKKEKRDNNIPAGNNT